MKVVEEERIVLAEELLLQSNEEMSGGKREDNSQQPDKKMRCAMQDTLQKTNLATSNNEVVISRSETIGSKQEV